MTDQASPAAPRTARRLVDEQAEDEGLWFVAQTAPEAYLQQELRRLHAAIETEAAALDGTTTDCPLHGVHEHAFRGPHRFHEWDPAAYSEASE